MKDDFETSPDKNAHNVEHDRRGGDGTPAVGRREYDHLDEYLTTKLEQIARATTSSDGPLAQAAKKTRAIVLASATVISTLLAIMFWLGVRGVGPGERADQNEHSISSLRDTVVTWHNDRIRESDENRQGLYFLLRKNCSAMTDREIRDFNGVDICDAAWHPLDHAIKAKGLP